MGGGEVEDVAVVAQEVVEGVPLVEQSDDRRVGLAELLVVEAVGVVAVEDAEDQVAAVVGHLGVWVARLVVSDGEDVGVFGLRRSDRVVVDRDL